MNSSDYIVLIGDTDASRRAEIGRNHYFVCERIVSPRWLNNGIYQKLKLF
jgi:hypothetical protein